MTGPDVSPGKMPEIPATRVGDVSPADLQLSERLLDGTVHPDQLDPAGRGLALLLSAARQPVPADQSVGRAAAFAAFQRFVVPGPPLRRRLRRRVATVLSAMVSSKLALAATAAAAAVGGTTAAAYANALPAGLQTFAHHAIGAPAPQHSGQPAGRPVGPNPAGPAGFGLCNAYLHGGLDPHSVAYRNLAKAAAGDITSYCKTIQHPGSTGRPANPGHHHSSHPGAGAGTHHGRPDQTGPSAHPHPTGPPAPAGGHGGNHQPSGSAADNSGRDRNG
jgi:hypothetical protein